MESNFLGTRLGKVGPVLSAGSAGSFDEIAVESLYPFFDPESGRLAGVYTGYGRNLAGQQVASIGLAYSDDGITWEKAGKFLGGSGIADSPDEFGCTAPVVIYRDGFYYVFRTGLTEPGYEGGTKRVLLSVTPTLRMPSWTHYGVVMSPDLNVFWRAKNVWHPNFIWDEDAAVWYCFINASGGDAKERIGYAKADSLVGPWIFDDLNSPLIIPGTFDSIAGDPHVRKTKDGWRMDYFTAGDWGAVDWYTVTTEAAFPIGWTPHNQNNNKRITVAKGSPGAFDDLYAHKPIIFEYGGRLLHYYTAVNAISQIRQVGLAIEPPPTQLVASSPIAELTTTRLTQSKSLTVLDKSTVVFDTTGKRQLEVRLVVRVNPGYNGICTVQIADLPNAKVSLAGASNTWRNGASPWVPMPDVGLFNSYCLWSNSDGTTAQFGNGQYEFRWVS